MKKNCQKRISDIFPISQLLFQEARQVRLSDEQIYSFFYTNLKSSSILDQIKLIDDRSRLIFI